MAAPARRTLIVDAANVIGARPDGWWRDRPAAVVRLLTALSRITAEEGEIVLVVEGAGKAGAAQGITDGVRVVHAEGSGDDEIVAQVAAATSPVTVVTADRALRARVEVLGADTLGPRTLWQRLER